MGQRAFTNSFAGGEQSPLMLGQLGDAGYRTGFEHGRNMLVLPTGAVTKRPPFKFVKAVKSGVTQAKLFPFVYGNGDAYAMEWGPNSVRFHTGGATLKWANPVAISSFSTVSDAFTTATSHGLSSGNVVRFGHRGIAIPGNVQFGTAYYALVTSATTFQVETSLGGGAIALAGAEAINETVVIRQSELPREYVPSIAVSSVSTGADTFTFGASHQFVTGDEVLLTNSGGSLPTASGAIAIVSTRTYFVIVSSGTAIQIADTREDALAGTEINLTAAGSGTHTVWLYYRRGDIIWAGNASIPASTSSRLFWSTTDGNQTAPSAATEWYQMPRDGTYEIGRDPTLSELPHISYDQSFDVFAFTTDSVRARHLTRELVEAPSGSHATADVVRWSFRPIDLPAVLDAPTPTLSGSVFGEYYAVTWGINGIAAIIDSAATDPQPHTFVAGDVIYMEGGTIGSASAISGISGTPGFFIITQTGNPNAQAIRMRRINGGSEVTGASGGTRTGFVRLASSSSKTSHEYVVSSVADNGDESEPSSPLTVVNILETPGSSNTIVWSAVDGAARYRIYRKFDEVYGLIGETDLLTFTDDGIQPDNSVQPVVVDETLASEWPQAIGNFQQRQWFGGTEEHPRRVWASKTGTQSTMSYHERTLLDTDRIRFDVTARERTLVRHIVPAYHLWLLTSSAEIRVSGPDGQRAIVASKSPDLAPISNIGCSRVRPIVAGTNILFVGDRTKHVHELPAQANQLLDPPDLSVRSHHLFDGYTITQSAQTKAPVPIEWFVRSDGALVGLTYMPEQNIRGWHVHTAAGTNAVIESACWVPESDGDWLYVCVARTVNSSTVRYIEAMRPVREITDVDDADFLDSLVTYDGAATTTIPVAHLEGQSVYAVADGEVVGPFTVASGIITLTEAASLVHVGLLYTPTLRLLPTSLMVDGYGKGRTLNVKEASLRIQSSGKFQVARYTNDSRDTCNAFDATGVSDGELMSRDVSVSTERGWNRGGQIQITQNVPLPLTIVSVTLDVEVGG